MNGCLISDYLGLAPQLMCRKKGMCLLTNESNHLMTTVFGEQPLASPGSPKNHKKRVKWKTAGDWWFGLLWRNTSSAAQLHICVDWRGGRWGEDRPYFPCREAARGSQQISTRLFFPPAPRHIQLLQHPGTGRAPAPWIFSSSLFVLGHHFHFITWVFWLTALCPGSLHRLKPEQQRSERSNTEKIYRH